ncbi:MAG: zf-HC2 domain-containing protein [Bdellovibrionota bacterium]
MMNEMQLEIFEKEIITCHDVENLYGEYMEGDLIPSLADRLREHICECAKCQEFACLYNQVIDVASQIKDTMKLSDDVKNRLHERLNKELGLSLPVISKSS